MRICFSNTKIITLTVLAFFSALTVSARKTDNKPLERADSVNMALAVYLSDNISAVVNNLSTNGLPVNNEQLGVFLAQALVGHDFGMTSEQAMNYIDSRLREGTQLSVESQKAFLEKSAKESGAIVTPSGLVFQVITEGEGISPTFDNRVQVRYVGRFSDGSTFDDTESDIVTIDMGSEIAGFVEGLQMMKPGGTYRIVVPAELAYGEEGIPGIIPGNAALDFTVTLEGILPPE